MKNKKSRFSWILFDADNTIFDFHASSEIAFQKSFECHKLTPEESWYIRFKELNHIAWKAFDENKMTHEDIKAYRFGTLFGEIGVRSIDPLEFNALYYNQLVENIRYVDGAIDILNFLYGKSKLAVITNGMKEVQRPRLKSSVILDKFDHIFVSGEIGFSKPNPSFFKYVYEEIGETDKSKVMVVGDNLVADIKGGNDFGFKTSWFNPFNFPRENGIVPDFEINSLSELRTILHPEWNNAFN